MKNLIFIGPISPPFTGPGVKNKIILEAILESKKWGSIAVYNTLVTKDMFSLFFNCVFRQFSNLHIILSVSKKGRFVLIPLLAARNRKQTQITLLPAGGQMDKELQSLPPYLLRLYLQWISRLDDIIVETHPLHIGLKTLGIASRILPNPRKIMPVTDRLSDDDSFRVIFLSSIKESKGILDVIKAVDILDQNGMNINLSIYGRIQDSFKSTFTKSLDQSNKAEYKGELESEHVHSVLSTEADLLVLPTFYKGEGLPGILVECVMAELPFIVTEFPGITHYFQDGTSCLFTKPQSPEHLAQQILKYKKDSKLYESVRASLNEKKHFFSDTFFVNSL